jgi:hypothetical protein
MNSQILDKVQASGVCGIKKAELKKLFGADTESSLEALIKDDQVIVDNKGIAHYVWSKENYLSHITQNDPKFKILSKIVKNLEDVVHQLQGSKQSEPTIDFENQFNKEITALSTSLGWVPFVAIRQKICQECNISAEKFYSYASSLIEANQSKYEISTGGQEGVLVRGLLHGYVRRL